MRQQESNPYTLLEYNTIFCIYEQKTEMIKILTALFEPRNPLSCKTKNTNFEGKEKMVEESGKRSNTSVLDELVKWGAIIENMPYFSGGREMTEK